MKQIVKLGDKIQGQIEIVALGVEFVEKPATFKYDKYSTYKSIYLEITQDVLKEIDAFYLSVQSGDKAEGIANSQPYYKILGMVCTSANIVAKSLLLVLMILYVKGVLNLVDVYR